MAQHLNANRNSTGQFDRKYISNKKSEELYNLIEEIKKMTNALITYPGHSDLKGQKFKGRDNKKP